jgi:voltage-gated potassium channel
MGPAKSRIFSGERLNRKHFTLMVLLFVLLLSNPLIPGPFFDSVFLSAVLLSTWLAGGKSPKSSAAKWMLAILGGIVLIAHTVFPEYVPGSLLQLIRIVLEIMIVIALFLCGAIILRALLTTERVSTDEIIGTVNLYLILGFIWSYIYNLVEVHIPNSFNVAATGDALSSKLIYFSFVTLTTLGYGDISPQRPMAEMLTIVEAIIGQFYVAVVVTYLLSIYITQTIGDREGKSDGISNRTESSQ